MNCRPLPQSGQMGLVQVYESCSAAMAADLADPAHHEDCRPQALPQRPLNTATLLDLGVIPSSRKRYGADRRNQVCDNDNPLGRPWSPTSSKPTHWSYSPISEGCTRDPRKHPEATPIVTYRRGSLSETIAGSTAAPSRRGGMLTKSTCAKRAGAVADTIIAWVVTGCALAAAAG